MQYTFPNYNRFPFDLVRGDGVTLYDQTGKAYLDLTSGIGVCGLGYNQPDLNAAVTEQVQKLWHTSNMYESALQDEVAKLIVGTTPYLVAFSNSGTEANEAAIKLARKATGKQAILSFDYSFHGRSYGSLSVTGNQPIKEGFGAMLPGARYATYNDPAAIAAITSDLAAVILEVVQGEGGVNVGETSWLQAVQAKCHEVGALLIIDEIQTGMGRTGSKYAFEQANLTPDIFTLAKGLANGLPVGAMVGRAELAPYFGPGSHGSTFAGNPVVMAAAKGVLTHLTPELLQQVQATSNYFWTALAPELLALPAVESLSGRGLMIGIHLTDDCVVGEVMTALHQLGVLTTSARGNTLRLLPPLVITPAQLAAGVTKIKQVLGGK